MENCYRNFYRNFYIRTGGFIPMSSLSQTIFPGDFFQIRNGEIIVLGNIFRKGIIDPEDAVFGKGIKQNAANWTFSDGVSKSYSGRGSGNVPIVGEFEFSRQILAFANKGSFFFKGNHPESVKIINWNELKQQLIIKMTQVIYSFRELYIATETATASDWALAIAGSEKGELEIATDSEMHGMHNIFGIAKIIQSKDIEYYHKEPNRMPVFFKAKKLVVQNERTEIFISDLISEMQGSDEWASNFYDYDFSQGATHSQHIPNQANACLLDMLQANELNPNTALLYFKWEEANLNDVEKLFFPYGN